ERKILISTYSKLVSYYKMSKTSPIYSCLFVTLMIGINKYNYVKRKVKEISNKKFVKKPLDFDDEIMKNFYEYKKQFMTGNLEDEDIYLEDKVSDDGIVDMKKEKRKRGRPRKNEV
ncbi:MAG: hypothetical protein NZM44_00895, partial [Candidatus Calescibacterium sp.]|nr:hypothetical protein [Candidatus Calescibacterium sp.]